MQAGEPDLRIAGSSLPVTLRLEYQSRSNRIREDFDASHDGAVLIKQRSELVDHLIERLWYGEISGGEAAVQGLTLAAVGGYGRQQLFPYSDIDLLFIARDAAVEEGRKTAVRRLCQDLWDIGLRLSATTRTIDECAHLSDENPEFSLSLLDRRCIAGDISLFQQLDRELIPRMIARRRNQLLTTIVQLAGMRHRKFQQTIFHLEPNVKDGLGGLRDYQTCIWLDRLLQNETKFAGSRYEIELLAKHRDASMQAHQCLTAIRTFLHYRGGRDDNMLYWHAQDEAAELCIGLHSTDLCQSETSPITTANWMRRYFRHARSIDWLTQRMLDEIPSSHFSLIDQIAQWRSRTVVEGCPVESGRIWLRTSEEYKDPNRVLTLFRVIATQRLKLSMEAEGHLSESLPLLAERLPQGAMLWEQLRQILLEPEVAYSLRLMHALGILELAIPEFREVDALVVRDAYHRYTVDEHTFLILENLHALEQPDGEWEKNFSSILRKVAEPELLYLAAILHDIGKARGDGDHAEYSVEVAAAVCERWQFTSTQRGTILWLIRQHLSMSQALRKDIFDMDTVQAFGDLVGTLHHLRLLTLLTYADIRSVNPEALTPWKAENLWRLFIATSNYLDRTLDEHRIGADADTAAIQDVIALSPRDAGEIHSFLAGLPQRYLRTRTASEILAHWQSFHQLDFSGSNIALTEAEGWWECTLITRDRPYLFSDVAGALTAWGMDIITVDAFSNATGVVIDTFRFLDRYDTLTLNPAETERFQTSLTDVVEGTAAVGQLLASRIHALRTQNNKIQVETKFSVDNASSTHSTILQVVTQDRPGLLRNLSLVIAEQRCDISVALVDTEGEMAIDVFYLTKRDMQQQEGTPAAGDAKLDSVSLKSLKEALAEAFQVPDSDVEERANTGKHSE